MPKATLRKEMLEKRRLFASDEISAILCEKAAALPELQNAETVMLYLSAKSEVNTALLLSLLLREGKKVCAPRVLDDENMEAARIDESGFQKGRFGLWEPKGERQDAIDFIFVPGVAFDKQGNRLGYGKGYYDRFLAAHPAKTAGLCYSCQVVSKVPSHLHDKPLDMILTEEAIYA